MRTWKNANEEDHGGQLFTGDKSLKSSWSTFDWVQQCSACFRSDSLGTVSPPARPRPASTVIKDRCTNPVIEIMLQEFHEWGKKQNVESPRSPQQQAAQQSFKRRSPKITRRDGLVSIVFYSRLSLMIIAWLSQFHVYLPWGQHLFSWGLNRVIFENLRLKLYWPAAAAGQMGIVVVDNSGYISREW